MALENKNLRGNMMANTDISAGLSPGATPEDWDHFDLILGLGEDLLPVVSNTKATVSPESKIKELGKTPSLYKRDRTVVGIAGWTSHQASDADIARWAREGDYGICLQTRTIRALDIDVADVDIAAKIVDWLGNYLARELPKRARSNTGKCLLAFMLPGDMPKRKMVVEGGIIEFLATGQQFIAVGTHPSGVRYEWQGGLPLDFPSLTLEQFEDLWQALVERFATEAPSAGQLSRRVKGGHVKADDPVAAHLREHELVTGRDRDGALIVVCPWEKDHTTGERGDGSTVWFPAGMNGYERGHFKCLHGHCEGRGDSEFFAAVDYVEDVSGDFEVIVYQGPKEPERLPPFKRDKNGNIEATIENVAMAVARPDVCGCEIRFDQFRDEIMFSRPGEGDWQGFTDSDYARMRITLERGHFKPVGRELMRDVVMLVADNNQFDSAIAWLDGLKWDGVPRVTGFLTKYFGAEPGEYTEAVSLYLWTALAGRVKSPGCKADMVPILVGEQGSGKSSGVAAMAPALEFFSEVSFHEKDEDLARKMRGRLVAEIGELRGLHTKELETIKAFITRTHENWIPKYREFAVQFPRRLVFIGTTNKDEFLADETGNRRWLPVRVNTTDLEGIKADRLQLWAEARELYLQHGVQFKAAEDLSIDLHAEHMISDSWEEVVEKWLDEADLLTGDFPRSRYFLRVGDVLRSAVGFDDKQINRREELRMGAVLRTLGYTRRKLSDGGKKIWAYLPQVP
jgi:predicted P-loop ATPase